MNNLTFAPEEIEGLISQAVTKAEQHIKTQKWSEAEVLLKQTLRVDPQCETALRMLAQLVINHNPKEAIGFYEKILEMKPFDQESLNNAAICYSGIGLPEKGIDKLEKCLEMHPNDPMSYGNLALQYKDMGKLEKARETYLAGLAKFPENTDLLFNYGVFLTESHEFSEAIKYYEKCPDMEMARFNSSLNNLLLGNYERGWEEYEARFSHDSFGKFKKRFHQPEWKGESLEGKTILIWNEQGVGDAIQFARYLPLLKAGKVVLEVVPELVNLMTQCKGVDLVIPQRSHMPKHDYQISIASLPRILKINEPFYDGPYIQPTGSAEKAFVKYNCYRKIGICWAGNPVHRHDNSRSCFLKYFKHLNMNGTKLFAIQKDSRPRLWKRKVVDLTEGCKDMGVVDMSDLLIDFNYTASIMKCMDHIVTVDTAVAHLAGAMGLPCYLMLPYTPDWRWGLKEITTKWYPSLKILRQKEPGNYESILKHIAYEIRSE